MKKILLSTIIDYNNYGNRLQNFALQELLTKVGFKVETLLNNPTETKVSSKIKYILSNRSIIDIFSLIIRKINFFKKNNSSQQFNQSDIAIINLRRKHFLEFTHNNIVETPYKVYADQCDEISIDDYECFVTGSDQVWNPNFRYGSPIDFLRFAPENKRIAYAPSIGIDELPEKHKKNYALWLKEIPYLSVREEAGAKIIENLTGRKVPVLVDPTLLLSKEKWLQVTEASPNKPKTKYVATYFLGGLSDEQLEYVNNLAETNNLEIVNLGNPEFERYYTAGPSEFLDFIYSSEIFLTNSFHGVVFSILFEKPFIVFKRGNMNSRIDTLLKKFKLENRKFENINDSEVFQIDYSHVPDILNSEREKSLSYLKAALNIKEEE